MFAHGSDTSRHLSSFDHSHAMRQLLLHQVTKAAESSDSPQSDAVREFIIATWTKNLAVARSNPEKFVGVFDLELVRSHGKPLPFFFKLLHFIDDICGLFLP